MVFLTFLEFSLKFREQIHCREAASNALRKMKGKGRKTAKNAMTDPLPLGLDLRRQAKEKIRKNIKIYETNQRLKTRERERERERERMVQWSSGRDNAKMARKTVSKKIIFLAKMTSF
jgi:hypothetical protein